MRYPSSCALDNMTQHSNTISLQHRRRGISAPALLMALMMTIMFVVLVVDLAQLSIQKHQMQIGADAATLGTAPAAMDRRWLYLGKEENDNLGSTVLADVQQFQLEDVHRKATALAAEKKVAGKLIDLQK